jgi:hypothetical protein
MRTNFADRFASRRPRTAEGDYAAGCLDASAGCEYVDDQIRVTEPEDDHPEEVARQFDNVVRQLPFDGDDDFRPFEPRE